MIHELRRGPVADLGVSPRDAYYGSQTTPHMFVLALSELWHWTGEIEVLRRYRDAALSGLEWAARCDCVWAMVSSNINVDRQKAWPTRAGRIWTRRSAHANAALAEGPMATVEEEAFYFVALQRMGEILIELDDYQLAESYLQRAEDPAPGAGTTRSGCPARAFTRWH